MLTSLTLTFRLTDVIIERIRITPKETTLYIHYDKSRLPNKQQNNEKNAEASLSSIAKTNKPLSCLHASAMTRGEPWIWASRETYSIYSERSMC